MVCGDEVEHGKPFPDIYQKAADMLGVNIKHTLVIEDSYNGIRAGHAAGASVIMVPDLVQPTDEIRQMTDYVVSDLGKVISCISNFETGIDTTSVNSTQTLTVFNYIVI